MRIIRFRLSICWSHFTTYGIIIRVLVRHLSRFSWLIQLAVGSLLVRNLCVLAALGAYWFIRFSFIARPRIDPWPHLHPKQLLHCFARLTKFWHIACRIYWNIAPIWLSLWPFCLFFTSVGLNFRFSTAFSNNTSRRKNFDLSTSIYLSAAERPA